MKTRKKSWLKLYEYFTPVSLYVLALQALWGITKEGHRGGGGDLFGYDVLSVVLCKILHS